jgi:transcriptional regulator with XRE-family HTH domain
MPPRLPTDPALGRAIRQLREQRGLTQEELATHAGMTFGTVSRLESAKSAPAWATVRALLETLDVSLSDLARTIEAQERAK